ncbi:hypothetical protein CVV43_04155 [Candidatus Saccharibacteria bacterium HGW-Saccharibacteria-1]|nr:MAG: hypothetical protein CVV43_04155 [Candidatus Saccharibacteria bacterium HGW-Saccharibacteria-1]
MKLSDFVDINPRVVIPKGTEAEFVPMEAIDPSRRYVQTYPKKNYAGGIKFVNGDTLFARITPCLENGKIAQFISSSDIPAFGSTEYWVFRAKEGISDPGYVYYLAKSNLLRKSAEKSMIGASGRQRAQIEAVKDIDIGNIILEDQRKIAGILGAYDDLIENNSKRIEKLESMARLLYRHYFEVPEADSWEVVRIGDILSEAPRSKKIQKSEYKKFGSYPIIDQGKEHIAGYTDDIEAVISDRLPLTVFGDHTRIIKLAQNPFARGADGTQIIVSDILPPYYLHQTMKGISIVNEHYARHFKSLKITKIKRPPSTLLCIFEEKVEPIFKQINVLTKKNYSLAKARDLLLPRVMMGDIDV